MQVVEVGDEGVVAVVGRARMLVGYGEMVRANGRSLPACVRAAT